MPPDPLPWPDWPTLTLDRLQVVSAIIQDVHAEVAELFDPDAGDGAWDRGCRAYSRRCHRIIAATNHYPWLTIPAGSGSGLEFTFAIGGVPIKSYRGEPYDVPARYL